MRMVYGLLKYRIKYVGDDKDLEEEGKKMDEIWINYCGMLVCFVLREFAIVMGLRCDRLEEPIAKASKIAKRPSKTNKCKEKIDGLLDIDGCVYRALDLMTNLKDKTIPKQYREKLCLVWFAHSVILARNVNKAWAFEVIPPLRKQVMDYPDEVSYPRMFRWLAAKNYTKIKEVELFNSLDDAVHLLQIK
ncbi:hypothetical protein FXO38_11901 [Capsicum annuum]|nr:hypothetical protein FXO37_31332 [Capsicum annuum]KAF3661049.1 hypothetical protein FXO38_11901 [Capsicum annuum]